MAKGRKDPDPEPPRWYRRWSWVFGLPATLAGIVALIVGCGGWMLSRADDRWETVERARAARAAIVVTAAADRQAQAAAAATERRSIETAAASERDRLETAAAADRVMLGRIDERSPLSLAIIQQMGQRQGAPAARRVPRRLLVRTPDAGDDVDGGMP